ncbi:MAG TPA: hypothetical protein VEH84_16630 [Alphaproteobacteria bacterium]|nr:hypothetical protein [Alphaproteobacteria bacterium]
MADPAAHVSSNIKNSHHEPDNPAAGHHGHDDHGHGHGHGHGHAHHAPHPVSAFVPMVAIAAAVAATWIANAVMSAGHGAAH